MWGGRRGKGDAKGGWREKRLEQKMEYHSEDIYAYATAGRVLRYWEKTDILLSENEPPKSG